MNKLEFFFIVSSLLLLLYSCDGDKATTVEFPNQIELYTDHEVELAGTFIPLTITTKDGITHIVFMVSARSYTISFDDESSLLCIELIKQAIENKTPLKVYCLKNSNEIAKIKQVSQKEKEICAPKIKTATTLNYKESMTRELAEIYIREVQNQTNSHYIGDGCAARAHTLRKLLHRDKYACGKIFVFATQDSCLKTHHQSLSCCSCWVYHVAVTTNVNMGPFTEKMVLDPILGLHSIQSWLSACTNCNKYRSIDHWVEVDDFIIFLDITHKYGATDEDYHYTEMLLEEIKDRSGC